MFNADQCDRSWAVHADAIDCRSKAQSGGAKLMSGKVILSADHPVFEIRAGS